MFKAPHLSHEKNMTSLLLPGQKSEGGSQQYSVMREYSNSEISLFDHVYQHTNDKYTVKRLKAGKKEREAEFKPLGSTNYDDIGSDVIVTESNGDVTRRDVNKPIARKRYAQKHSFVSKKGFIKSSLRVCSRTFTKIALMLAIVISILGGLFNIKLPERKSTIGTSPSLSPSEPLVVLSFLDYSTLSSLRESTAAIIGNSEGLWSRIHKVMFLNDNQQLTRCMKVLQNTITHAVTICNNRSPSSMLKLFAPYCYATRDPITFSKNVLAGKHVNVYIFPFTNFCTFRVDYLDIYTVNLDSDDNFTVFYSLIYLYIYNVYRSWASCNWATYPEAILVNIYTLGYFSSKVIVLIIKSHDKYQSLILIGLACAEKARSRIQTILFHYRSYWREWRPLVTPWACCIKEGIEPWKSRRWLFTSLSALSFFSCSVSAFVIIIIVIIIITMYIYLQRVLL